MNELYRKYFMMEKNLEGHSWKIKCSRDSVLLPIFSPNPQGHFCLFYSLSHSSGNRELHNSRYIHYLRAKDDSVSVRALKEQVVMNGPSLSVKSLLLMYFTQPLTLGSI